MKMLALALLGALLALSQPATATEAPQNFAVFDAPAAVPEISFADGAGQSKTLADYSGKVVLLNVWATWCAPCRKEMPTLDRLQAKLGGPDFEVVALSMDRKGPDAVKKFFAETGVNTSVIIAYKPKAEELERLNAESYSVFVRDIHQVGYEKRTSKRNVFFNPIYKVDERTFEVLTDTEGRPILDEEFTETISEFRDWALGQEETLQRLFLRES